MAANTKLEVAVTISYDSNTNPKYTATYSKTAGPGQAKVEDDGDIVTGRGGNAPNSQPTAFTLDAVSTQSRTYEFQSPGISIVVVQQFGAPSNPSANVCEVTNNNGDNASGKKGPAWDYTLNCIDTTDSENPVNFPLHPRIINW